MIPNLYPADELAMIRAQRRRLDDRERQLKKGNLSGRLNPVGYEATVEIKSATHHVLRKDRLPPEIRNNPKFWTKRVVRSVVLRKIGSNGLAATPQRGSADPSR